jgi:hypothetical protein
MMMLIDDHNPGKPTFEELHKRIWADLMHYSGPTLIKSALVWHGYLAALIEWGFISPYEHGELITLLPLIEDNPVRSIYLGWPEEGEDEE